jgi:hypothetical protein
MARRLLLLGRLAAATAALALAAAPAQAQPSAAAVKAAFLTKFPGYVAWPPPARPGIGAPVVLCVLGGDPFGGVMDSAARGQQVDGHPLQLRRLANADGAGACHVAFVQGASAGAMLDGLRSKPVLTVTDEGSAGARGIIHFAVVEGRVRFTIDAAAAAERGLTISSRLLAIALSVRQRRS